MDEIASHPHVKFENPEASYTRGSDVSRTVIASSKTREATKHNKNLFREFCERCKEFIVDAEYDVFVVDIIFKGGRLRKGDVPTIMRLNRKINLLQVSVDFLVAFTNSRDCDAYFRSHGTALRSAVRLAHVFRSLVQDKISESCSNDLEGSLKATDEARKVDSSALKVATDEVERGSATGDNPEPQMVTENVEHSGNAPFASSLLHGRTSFLAPLPVRQYLKIRCYEWTRKLTRTFTTPQRKSNIKRAELGCPKYRHSWITSMKTALRMRM